MMFRGVKVSEPGGRVARNYLQGGMLSSDMSICLMQGFPDHFLPLGSTFEYAALHWEKCEGLTRSCNSANYFFSHSRNSGDIILL